MGLWNEIAAAAARRRRRRHDTTLRPTQKIPHQLDKAATTEDIASGVGAENTKKKMASEVAAAAVNVVRRAGKEMHGIVVSAGLMDKTVKVKLGGLRWEPRVQKVSLADLEPPPYIIYYSTLPTPAN